MGPLAFPSSFYLPPHWLLAQPPSASNTVNTAAAFLPASLCKRFPSPWPLNLVKKSEMFSTAVDNQTNVEIHIYKVKRVSCRK
jgi:hypothetical protein